MALLNQFIDFEPIVALIDEKFGPRVDRQLDLLREQVVAMIPVVGAAAAKMVIDKFPDLVRAFLKGDPDIPFLSNIFDLSEAITGEVNNDDRIPFQLPGLNILGDLLKGLGR